MDIYAEKIDVEEFGSNNLLTWLVLESKNVIQPIENQHIFKVCFSENEDFNAAAYELGKKSWINISISCVKQIYHHALLVMGRPELLPMAGREEEFEGEYSITEFEEPEIIRYDDKYKQIVFYSGPENPERQQVAELITFFALEFLMFHEMGHHLGGHIRYVAAEMGLTTLYAYGNGEVFDNQFYQMLENDADALAVSTLLESISTKIDGYSSTFLQGKRSLIPHCIIIALTIIFFLLPDEENMIQDSAYLPRNVRLYLCLEILLDKFETDYRNCLIDQSKEGILLDFQITNQLLQELYSERVDKKALSLDLAEYRNYYRDVLLPRWALIREKLVPYASVKLPQ